MKNNYIRYPDFKAKSFTISFDDNVTQDERLIELMEQYGIKGTFNIIPHWFRREDDTSIPEDPTYINVTAKVGKELYDKPFIEVANHSYDHAWFNMLPPSMQLREIQKGREELEHFFDRILTGFAYPYGCFTADTEEILRLAGITYARTVTSTNSFYLPQNWLEWNPTCHYASENLHSLTNEFLDLALEDLEVPRCFYVWGHTFEMDRMDNWNVIEDLFATMSGKEDIWYATNGEICDYMKSAEQLVYSMDETYIKNPTSTEIFMEIDEKKYRIKPGETAILR